MTSRRTFLKLSSAVGTLAIFPTVPFISGCNEDDIVNSLKVADSVAKEAAGIIAVVNPEIQTVLLRISSDIEVVIKAYNDYEVATAGKETIASLIQATVSTISSNLASILDAVGVRNKDKIQYIAVAVAVVNSAVTIVLAHIQSPQNTMAAAQAMVTTSTSRLPVIDGAKSSKDLKNAWNHAVEKGFPNHKVQ